MAATATAATEVAAFVKFAKDLQGVKLFDVSSLLTTGTALAAQANKLQGLSGQQKKALVLAAMEEVVKQAEQSETEPSTPEIKARFEALRAALKEALPTALDIAVAAARGQLDLRKIEPSVLVRLFSCCVRSTVDILATQNLVSKEAAEKVKKVTAGAEEAVSAAAESKSSEVSPAASTGLAPSSRRPSQAKPATPKAV